MSVFAGFWVDGAVRKPDARYADITNMFFVLWKDRKEFDLVNRQLFSKFEGVYWLDTLPRESLTPEELWSMVKVLFPSAVSITKVKGEEWMWNGSMELSPRIDWGNLTQYPPPVEPQWVRITRENVREHMHKPCRFHDVNGWREGYVAGWITIDGCCLVESDYSNTESVMQWSVVEVQA